MVRFSSSAGLSGDGGEQVVLFGNIVNLLFGFEAERLFFELIQLMGQLANSFRLSGQPLP